jgi:DNA-binding transcriptional ArsR family regulator
MKDLPIAALEQVAAYFQALSEPTRLHILNLLRGGELNVGELAELCDCTSANISRHLAMLMQHGLVQRQSRGTAVYYRIADRSVYSLCDLVCGSIGRRLERTALVRRVFAAGAAERKGQRRASTRPKRSKSQPSPADAARSSRR